MLVRHGHVVAEGWWEPYSATTPHLLFSVSKSFTSTAIGMLVAEGRLSIDTPVLTFFPDDTPTEPGDKLQAMRVRHLLSMATGHASNPTTAVFSQTALTWTRAFLQQPVEFEPGTHFAYNTAATYMLSAIAQKITGMRLRDYLQSRLFQPLGIVDPQWETSPQGIDVGGSGLSITTEAIARFGQLYLQKGLWQGRRLIEEAWIDEATARQVDNAPSPNSDWEQGYGYQFWRCRHGAYRGDGAFGQFCVILPDQETVLAITGGMDAMQPVLDLVWEHVLPALEPTALPEDRAAQSALTTRLMGLRLPPPDVQSTSPIAGRISGKVIRIADNDNGIKTLTFDFSDTGCRITVDAEHGREQIMCGAGTWERGVSALDRGVPKRVAASGAWRDEQTYVVDLWWYETPFRTTLTCQFNGDRLDVTQQVNVAFGHEATERPRLRGAHRLNPSAQSGKGSRCVLTRLGKEPCPSKSWGRRFARVHLHVRGPASHV